MRSTFFSILFIFLLSPLLWSEEPVVIKIITVSEGNHVYFYRLLEESFKLVGKEVVFESLGEIPQTRVGHMLDTNKLSLGWFLESEKRDNRWDSVKVGLTGGLIGQRIFFIGKGKQHLFDDIYTLEDFREANLTGVLGSIWFDVDIWKYNDLPYQPITGNWRKMYPMLSSGDRDVDYCSRSITEILVEAKNYPMLDIEKRLLFIYDRDFIFYLSPDFAKKHGPLLEEALTKAREEGVIDRLVKEFYETSFQRLDYDNRIRIHLKTPR